MWGGGGGGVYCLKRGWVYWGGRIILHCHPFAQEGGGGLHLNEGGAYCLKRGGMYWGGRFISQGVWGHLIA